ncbi:MAG: YndJ family transporter [Acidobacteria bacterium]|nr:YndJ family transporter [Acidobacteriota bacterium]
MTVLELLAPYGLLVVVPLGLWLCGLRGRLCTAAALAGLLSGGSFAMEQGLLAAALATPYLFLAAWVCWIHRRSSARLALAQLVISAVWIVASRGGLRMPHFTDAIVIMTALHFLYAGFGASVLAAATGEALGDRSTTLLFRWSRRAVIGGPAMMVAGTTLARWVEVAAGMLLAMGVTIIAALAMVSAKNRIAQLCFSVAAASAVLGMAIACMYAWTGMGGAFWLPIPQMAITHGVANAIGFCTAGMLGHALERRP